MWFLKCSKGMESFSDEEIIKGFLETVANVTYDKEK
jgi:hypothetical protein